MRQTFFGAFTAASFALSTSAVQADTAIITVSNGYEGGVVVTQIYHNGGNNGCKTLAYNAAMAGTGTRDGKISATCLNQDGKIADGYVCDFTVKNDPLCRRLDPQ